MDKAKQYAQQTHQAALDELQGLPNSYNILRDISFYILNRNH
jgi:geranylgeranyl pyrophosphate synthase